MEQKHKTHTNGQIEWPLRRLGNMMISVASRHDIAEQFISFAKQQERNPSRPLYSTSANGQVITMYNDDPQLAEEFSKADQIVADGMPMVWYSKISSGPSLPERVATTDLFHDVAKRAEEEKISFYMLGAEETVNQKAVENTAALYPNLTIVGRHHGYFCEAEETDIVQEINDLKPGILWVSMGVPHEQRFISRHLDALSNVGVIKTSGGLFDFLSFRRSRAPHWMQILGLEWSYRAMLEPKRLGTRYALTNPKALKLLLTAS